jgi:hypothetical protein
MGWDSDEKKDMFIKNTIIEFISNLKFQTSLDEYTEEQSDERVS